MLSIFEEREVLEISQVDAVEGIPYVIVLGAFVFFGGGTSGCTG